MKHEFITDVKDADTVRHYVTVKANSNNAAIIVDDHTIGWLQVDKDGKIFLDLDCYMDEEIFATTASGGYLKTVC